MTVLSNYYINTICLGESISSLLGEEEDKKTRLLVKVSERNIIRNLADGAMSLEFLTAFDPKNCLEACIHVLGPNQASNASPASHDGQEVLYVLEGNIEMLLDGKLYLMEEGDCFMLNDCMLPHQFRNSRRNGSSRMLVISNPPYFANRNN